MTCERGSCSPEPTRGGSTTKPAGPLKMSYYTGPNGLTHPPAHQYCDPDRRDHRSRPAILAAGEIRTIITRKPDLKPAILTAYRDALPDGRRFIEAEVGVLDPDLLASLRAMNPSR